MKNYLAVYTGTPANMDAWQDMDEETRQERERAGIAAWKQWVADNEKAIVDIGSPLGRTKRITRDGLADTRNSLTAWTVVRAESQEAAARLFENHPHFAIFPGDGVEVMECLPIPGM